MKGLAILLSVLGACSYDASEDTIWHGTVKGDTGSPLAFAGFDPYPTQGYAFGGGIAAMGYLDDGGHKSLVEARLHFTDKHDFENAKSTAFPIALTITENSLTPGMGVDFFEQDASRSSDSQQVQTFHHDYEQHQTGTASGTFTVERTDYATFMDGHLSATVKDPSHDNATRVLELDIHYQATK
ncbi:MAG TPA: hypothetical protein VLB44_05575 [Kofleriaceae bacterium]|nr:hypothetical protein [Kofleriaceae bacterium]